MSLQSSDANGATAIVNAVVDSYIAQHNRYHQTANRTLKKNLEEERAKLSAQIEGLLKESMKIEAGPEAKSLRATLLVQDLRHLHKLRQTIQSKLAQLDFEIGQETYGVTVQDKAQVPKVPSTDRRAAYAAGAALLDLLVILAIFAAVAMAGRRPDASRAV